MKKFAVIPILLIISLLCTGCGSDNKITEQITKSPTSAAQRTVTISCAGDCTLGTDEEFDGLTLPVQVNNQNGDYSYFFRNVKPIFETDDIIIVNFEGTLSERGTRQDKTFAFRGKPEYVKILDEGSVEAVTLANNHSMDYGMDAFYDTKQYLYEAGIVWFENMNTAVMERDGVKVGLIGLNTLDGSAEENLIPAIAKVKSEGAEIIAIQIHWGVEGDNDASEAQIDFAHKAVDNGADLVIGHHPHVLQGIEEYKGKYIAYSLGNFCFGGNQNPKDKDTMIFRQTFSVKDGEVVEDDNYEIIPCSLSSVSSRNNYQPTPLTGDEAKRVLDKIKSFEPKKSLTIIL